MSYNPNSRGLHEYPYTDPTRYNDDWALNKIRDLQEQLDNISDDILNNAKAYTDEKVAGFQREVNALRAELTATESRINSANEQFKGEIRAQIQLFDARIEAFRDEINADIIGVNARTDLAIQQNNEYLFEELSKGLGQLRVVNYFTGERITIQAMFDYLANLHAEDGITIDELIERDKTVTELIALDLTMTDIALNGKNLIV